MANVIPESYPFLRIAKQFDKDYGEVLRDAQARRYDQPMPGGYMQQTTLPYGEFRRYIAELDEANKVQQLIRDGVIDWQTGATKGGHFDTPAECFAGCRDPNCPYIHLAGCAHPNYRDE